MFWKENRIISKYQTEERIITGLDARAIAAQNMFVFLSTKYTHRETFSESC